MRAIDNYVETFRKTGDFESLRDTLRQATTDLRASAAIFALQESWASAALSAHKAADIQRMRDDFDGAFALYGEALIYAQRGKDIHAQVNALRGLAMADNRRENMSAATEYIDQAIRLATSAGDNDGLFRALVVAAELDAHRRNLLAANDNLTHALTISDAVKDKGEVLFAYMDRADVYQKRGERCMSYDTNTESCDKAFDLAAANYARAIEVSTSQRFDFLTRQLNGNIAQLAMRRSIVASQKGLRDVLEQGSLFHPTSASDVVPVPHFLAPPADLGEIGKAVKTLDLTNLSNPRTSYIRGLAEQMQGNNQAALAAFLNTVRLLEDDRTRLYDDQSRSTFLEDKIDYYHAAVLQLLEQKRIPEAFSIMERSRARGLADLLTSGYAIQSTERERELFAQSVKLKSEIAAAQRKLFNIAGDSGDREAPLSARVAALQSEFAALQQRMAKESPRLKQLIVSEPSSLANVQASAKQGDYSVMEYLVLPTGVVVWVIGADDVHVLHVFLPRAQLATRVASVRASVTARETDQNASFDQRSSRELFLFLVGPALKFVRTSHIVIVPHEELNGIPFQLLQDPGNQAYFGERFQISYAPSATVLARLESKGPLAKSSILAITAPGGDALRDLVAIRRAFSGVVRPVVLTGPSKQDIYATVAPFEVVHFSTHGSFDQSNPLQSFLQLSSAQSPEAELKASEIFGLPLKKGSLVVLSACETGRVEVTPANERLGFEQALLYAGASNLVLSSWKVDPTATSLWMETFYRAAQTNSIPKSAQLALLAVKSRPEFNHPFYWAPFVMVGK